MDYLPFSKEEYSPGLDKIPQAVGEFPLDPKNMAMLVIDIKEGAADLVNPKNG